MFIEKHLLIFFVESRQIMSYFLIVICYQFGVIKTLVINLENSTIIWWWIILQNKTLLKFEILWLRFNWFLHFKNDIDVLCISVLLVNLTNIFIFNNSLLFLGCGVFIEYKNLFLFSLYFLCLIDIYDSIIRHYLGQSYIRYLWFSLN